MSSELANRLMQAESIESFLRDEPQAGEWQTCAALKAEVDRLIGSDLNAATQLATRLTQLAGLSDSPASRAFAEAGRARVLHQQGRHSEANDLYESAIALMRRARLGSEAAILQKQQVAALKYLGRFDEALLTARRARRLLMQYSPAQLAQLETNIGNVYYQLDNYKKALTYYERAHNLFAESGDDVMRAMVDFSRANIYTEVDKPDEALSLLENAAAAFDAAGLALKAAQCRFHIAYIHFLRGKYNTALNDYERASEELAALGDEQLVAWCNLEMADILLALNAFEDAHDHAMKAQAKFAELGLTYEAAKAALTRGLAALALRRFDEAQNNLAQARQTFVGQKNKIFTAVADLNLAELALQRGDTQEAATRAEAARHIFARQRLASRATYARLVEAQAAYADNQPGKAARLLRIVLREIDALSSPAVEYRSHHLLGRIERQRQRPAAGHFRNAVAVIESLRGSIVADEFKSSFLRDKIAVYEDAITACLDEGGADAIDEAFRLVESAKSRSLADLIASYARETLATDARADEELRARLAKLIDDLNWYASRAGLEEEKGEQRRVGLAENYRHEVSRCEKQIARLFRRLEAQHTLPALATDSYVSSADELRGALNADENAIEYFSIGDELCAFVASAERVQLLRHLASKSEVEKAVSALRFQIDKFNYGASYAETFFSQLKRAADGHLARLYEQLFAPLAGYLTSDKLIIIPHGALHYLPFHALRHQTAYLIDDFEISYAPSASVLRLCRERAAMSTQNEKSATSMLAFGVSESNTPGIEEEIARLSSLFAGSQQLTGAAATRDNLFRMAPQARFLHLASHGYFRRDNPMFSFLKLADSHLNFYSLLDLQLNAELVTLSACHTGVNAIVSGDELHGLMRGFLYAGAPSLVVSLWAVNDRSTTDFMQVMYSQMKAGVSKRTALRQAQLAVKDAYGHPYYWAAFVLMGDTSSISI